MLIYDRLIYYRPCCNVLVTHLTALFQDNLDKPAPERQTILDFNEARDDEWQWHQLDHMQIICTSLQTDNHTCTSSLIFKGQMLFLTK